MAEDLMSFSAGEVGGLGNSYEDEQDENVPPPVPPALLQSPVIKNSILKQSNKDNLIQLFTPAQKPVKGKLKVRFGHDSLLETPVVKQSGSKLDKVLQSPQATSPAPGPDKPDGILSHSKLENDEGGLPSVEELLPGASAVDEDEQENWIDRTSVLTKQDHQEYSQYATQFLHEIVDKMPVTGDFDEHAASTSNGVDEHALSTNSGVEDTAMEVTEFTPQVPDDDLGSAADRILLETEALIRSLREPEPSTTSSPDIQTPDTVQASNRDAEQSHGEDKPATDETAAVPSVAHVPDNMNYGEENMDFEEAIEVDDEVEVRICTDDEKSSVAQTEVKGGGSKEFIAADTEDTVDAANTEDTADDLGKNDFDHDQVSLGTNEKKSDTDICVNGISNIQECETGSNTSNQKDQNILDGARRPKPGHESSDEEFMSADEDMEVDEVKTPKKFDTKEDQEDVKQDELLINEGGNKEAESPERIPPKVSYNFNFDDLDAMDPFSTKTSVMNSPTLGDTDKQAKLLKVPEKEAEERSRTETDCLEDKKATLESSMPSKSSNQLANSAVSPAEEIFSKIEIAHEGSDKTSDIESVCNRNNNSAEAGKHNETGSVQPALLSSDDVNLDELDPFKPKSQIVNSPDFKYCGELPKHAVSEFVDTLKTERNDEQNECKEETENIASLEKEVNVFKEKDEVAKHDAEDASTPQKEDIDLNPENEPKMDESLELPKPKQGTYNFDEMDFDAVDPFQSRKQCMNSPDLASKPKSDYGSIDPFQTGKQLMNSPALKTDQKNDEKSASQLVDQPELNEVRTTEQKLDSCEPVKENAKHSLVKELNESSKAATVSSDVSTEKSDTANNEIVARLDINTETLANIDPFDIVNSPTAMKEKAATYDFDNLDGMDPFKPKIQMQNSQTTPNSGCLDLENLDDIDPFKPKKQMQNSPVPSAMNTETVVVESSDADSTGKAEAQLQGATTAQESDSAIKLEMKRDIFGDIDPFKPQQIVKSPVLGKEQAMTFDFDNLEGVDPFKPKKQMQNSPITSNSGRLDMDNIDTIDPFKSTKQMQNSLVSSAMTKESVELESSSVASDISVESGSQPKKMKISSEVPIVADGLDIIDPFRSLDKMVVSPRIPHAEENPFITKSRVAISPTVSSDALKTDFVVSALPPGKSLLESDGLDGANILEVQGVSKRGEQLEDFTVIDDLEGANILEVQGVSRRGEQPEGSTVVDQFNGDFVVDDSQFVPATEVFNDLQLDYLGQFGKKTAANTADTESTLSRMSLYVKFDPLVDAAPSNPRRISIRPAQLEKLKEFGLDDTLLLLGTPPKKRRQSLLARSTATVLPPPAVHDTRNRQTPLLTAAVGSQKTGAASFQPEAIDLILTVSPAPEDREKEVAAGSVREYEAPVMSSLLDANQPTEGGLFQELKYTDQDVERIRQKFKFEFQGLSITKDKEHTEKVAQLQLEIKSLRKCVQTERDAKAGIIATFDQLEETSYKLSAEKKRCEEKIEEVQQEKHQALQDVQGVENAFSDLHRRYEKLRTMIEQMLQNENTLKQSLAERLKEQKTMAEQMKSQTKEYEQKLDRKVQEAEKLKQQIESNQKKFEAQQKILRLKLEAAEKTITQKTEENKELTEICDKLLKNVEG